MMGDRATLEKIYVIMRRLLLIKLDGLNPIPRKGTTRHECYRALYEIQELLETRRCFGKHLPQTNADKLRAMTDEELAEWITELTDCAVYPYTRKDAPCISIGQTCAASWLDWLKEEAQCTSG